MLLNECKTTDELTTFIKKQYRIPHSLQQLILNNKLYDTTLHLLVLIHIASRYNQEWRKTLIGKEFIKIVSGDDLDLLSYGSLYIAMTYSSRKITPFMYGVKTDKMLRFVLKMQPSNLFLINTYSHCGYRGSISMHTSHIKFFDPDKYISSRDNIKIDKNNIKDCIKFKALNAKLHTYFKNNRMTQEIYRYAMKSNILMMIENFNGFDDHVSYDDFIYSCKSMNSDVGKLLYGFEFDFPYNSKCAFNTSFLENIVSIINSKIDIKDDSLEFFTESCKKLIYVDNASTKCINDIISTLVLKGCKLTQKCIENLLPLKIEIDNYLFSGIYLNKNFSKECGDHCFYPYPELYLYSGDDVAKAFIDLPDNNYMYKLNNYNTINRLNLVQNKHIPINNNALLNLCTEKKPLKSLIDAMLERDDVNVDVAAISNQIKVKGTPLLKAIFPKFVDKYNKDMKELNEYRLLKKKNLD